jgi:HEAT repeat protein
MRNRIFAIFFIVGLIITSLCYSEPITPKEKIPKGLPKDVRTQLEKLYSSDPVERGNAVINLGNSRTLTAIPFLIEMFTDQASLQQTHGSYLSFTSPAKLATEALHKIGKPTVKPLIEALLNDPEPAIRQYSAITLQLIKSQDTFSALISALKDKDRGVVEAAAKALALLKNPRALETLLSLMKEYNEKKWGGIAYLLGILGDKRAVDPLIAELKGGDALGAADALGMLRDRKAVTPLIGLLSNDSQPIRCRVAESLGNIGDESAVDPLINLLKDKDDAVRDYAQKALREITGKRFGEDYEKWRQWYHQTNRTKVEHP